MCNECITVAGRNCPICQEPEPQEDYCDECGGECHCDLNDEN